MVGNRRQFLRMMAGASAGVALLPACGRVKPSPGVSGGLAGASLRVLFANHPWNTAITPLLPDFTSKTGIKLNTESYGEDQLSQKLTTEFTAGGSTVDAFMQRPLQEGRLYTRNGWYADLGTFVNNTSKTPTTWNFQDFQAGAVQTETIGGKLAGVPIVIEHEVLYYRRDLLDAAKIAVPASLNDLQAAAAKLTDPAKGMFGFIARGQRSPAVTQFSSFLYSYGGDFFDQKTMKATLNTPQAIAAFQFYGNLLHKYGPTGVLNMSWPQAVAVFAQGKAALYTDADSIYQNLLDPTKSVVAGKTGVARFPAGPAGAVMYSVCSWGLSMAASSKNKDAAWQFMQWATSPEITLKVQGQGAVPEARNSVWQNPQGTQKFPQDWVAAAKASASGRPYDRPLLTQVSQARDIVGSVIVTAIEGGDVPAAAAKANSDLQALLDTESKK